MIKRKATTESKPTLRMSFDEALERFSRVNTKDIVAELPTTNGASPFVKWAGGKRGIIDDLVHYLPPDYSTYYEPFAGGAALYFELFHEIKKACISDSNLELILTYKVIQKDPLPLIVKLEEHAKKDSDEYFYKIRSQHNLQNPIDVAARFIYLNKTCYNGLYRVNKKGEFNVPRGRYANPDIVQRENILACNEALQNAIIKYMDFNSITPNSGDFVYCDPPYHPADTNAFTKYTKLDFSEKDQERLRDFAIRMNRLGVNIMLSNSDTPFIRNLYSGQVWNIQTVQAPRLVNCKSEGRVAVNELVIRNYQ